jgi:hypothetical protein
VKGVERMNIYGEYAFPVNIEREELSLSVIREGDTLTYSRECNGEQVKKTLLARDTTVVLNPVEPLNKPKPITPYFLASFNRTIVIGPKDKQTIFLTFPVEIGAYFRLGSALQVLDIFSLLKPRFTLYGDPANGLVCKYWKTPCGSTMPNVNPIKEGILELNLINTNEDCVEVTKAIFNAYGMKIFYSEEVVSMKATMRIKTGEIAETDFEESPLETGMKNSLEVYAARRILAPSIKFVMEHGL